MHYNKFLTREIMAHHYTRIVHFIHPDERHTSVIDSSIGLTGCCIFKVRKAGSCQPPRPRSTPAEHSAQILISSYHFGPVDPKIETLNSCIASLFPPIHFTPPLGEKAPQLSCRLVNHFPSLGIKHTTTRARARANRCRDVFDDEREPRDHEATTAFFL